VRFTQTKLKNSTVSFFYPEHDVSTPASYAGGPGLKHLLRHRLS
jgi:hypothetical protein